MLGIQPSKWELVLFVYVSYVDKWGNLREVLGYLQDNNSKVVHSLSKQVTYIRNLNSVNSLYTEALVNLSTLVKDNAVQSQVDSKKSGATIRCDIRANYIYI
jgi:hypothetical protein